MKIASVENLKSRTKDGIEQLIAGGTAGMVEVSIMHPLDLVKTRLQLGTKHYTGLLHCFKSTLSNEGVLGFYKGILPPILAETPKRATKFFTFEQYKDAFEADLFAAIPSWARLSLAGLCSGLTEAFVICPFEQKSSWQIFREIFNSKGISGIYLGCGATLYRHGIWNMFYFGLYHNLKSFIPSAAPVGSNHKYQSGNQPPVTYRLFLGFLAGTIASIVMRLGPGGGIMLVVYETIYDFLKTNF